MCVHKTFSTSTVTITSRSSLSVENYQDRGQRSARGEAGLKIQRQECGRLFEWSSKLRFGLSLYSKPIFDIVQGSQRPSGLDNEQMTACEGWDDANHNLFSILYFTTSGPAFSVVRRFEGKIRENGVGHGHNLWAALREKFDGFSREALRAAHRELKTVKMRSDEDTDDFLYKKYRCRDRLNSHPRRAPRKAGTRT